MWIQSGIFICSIFLLNLNIKFNFCARLDFNVFWFVKCMKIRIGNYASENVCCIFAGFEVVLSVACMLGDLSVTIMQFLLQLCS